jgi:hypothetical protein
MQQFFISLRFLLIIFLAPSYSCAQDIVNIAKPLAIYAGSTPCDSLIRTRIGIPGNAKCDFIKWQLTIEAARSDSFQIKATYGQSKPNTLGFIKATEFQAKGKYLLTTGTKDNPKAYILQLIAPEFKAPFIFIVMDRNILHFADKEKRLLVGNGGWGYVLNSIKNP